MGEFIIRVVVDVYRHVPIKDFEGGGIGCIASPAWNFAVLDSSEFVVLDPKVGLEYFRRRCEPEQGRVSRREATTRFRRRDVGQQSGADGSCSNGD